MLEPLISWKIVLVYIGDGPSDDDLSKLVTGPHRLRALKRWRDTLGERDVWVFAPAQNLLSPEKVDWQEFDHITLN